MNIKSVFFSLSLLILFTSCNQKTNKIVSSKIVKPIDTSVCYKIICVKTGKGIDIENQSLDNSARLVQTDIDNSDLQKFKFRNLGDGVYKICCLKSGKYLDVPENSMKDNTQIIQFTDHDVDNQKFYVLPADSNSYYFVTKSFGKILENTNDSTTKNPFIFQSTFTGNINQRFILKATM